MPTSCKSWNCLACRERKLSWAKSLITYGISMLGPCYLVSLTYVAIRRSTRTRGSLGFADAATVNSQFAALVRRLKSRGMTEIAWIKIPELTKKKQTHLHLIIGGIGNDQAACQNVAKYDREWLDKVCTCHEHTFSREWYKITGDSYVVDVRRVSGKFGAAAYVAKYLAKQYTGADRDELEKRGFLRRITCSRNWPRGGQMQRRGTVNDSWVKHSFHPGGGFKWWIDTSKNAPEAQQVGTDMAWELKYARQVLKGMKIHASKDGPLQRSTDGG